MLVEAISTPEIAPMPALIQIRCFPPWRQPIMRMIENTTTTSAMNRASRSGSSDTRIQLPAGMKTAAATPIGAIAFQRISWWTPGRSWAVTTISMRMMMATVWTGPNRIAKNGAISMPDPTPANPRISPAATAMPIAIRISCVRNPILTTHKAQVGTGASLGSRASRPRGPWRGSAPLPVGGPRSREVLDPGWSRDRAEDCAKSGIPWVRPRGVR